MKTHNSSLAKISKSCWITTSGDSITLERRWEEFATIPLMIVLVFTGFFAAASFVPELRDVILEAQKESFYDSGKYALFLVWGLFIPPIVIWYFSKTSITMTPKTIAFFNKSLGLRFLKFKYTLRSVDSFYVDTIRIGRWSRFGTMNVFQLYARLTNEDSVFLLKFLEEKDAQKVREFFQDFLSRARKE